MLTQKQTAALLYVDPKTIESYEGGRSSFGREQSELFIFKICLPHFGRNFIVSMGLPDYHDQTKLYKDGAVPDFDGPDRRFVED